MKELCLSSDLLRELEAIYSGLQREYERVATSLDFTCEGCPDNCCDSYFQHHTYLEWAYLWLGLRELTPQELQELVEKAKEWLSACEKELQDNRRPQVMCPLNKAGLCRLYTHRLLVCRTHGVPAVLTRPDGKTFNFPGCFRCQDIVAGKFSALPGASVPCVNRTVYLQRLATLENRLLDNRRAQFPKVKMTIADMIVNGPPKIP
jgi:Fe-S-cluster containining protein